MAKRRYLVRWQGDNTLTGGDADQFWIAAAEVPDSPNTIPTSQAGNDVIGIGGLRKNRIGDLTPEWG